MSFDTSQMTYGHLVTYPSVWLPPALTVKVLLLAHSQQQAMDYIEYLQEKYPSQNWAFYLIPDGIDYDDPVVDWIWINHFHMDSIILCAVDAFSVALFQSMRTTHKYVMNGNNPLLNKLCILNNQEAFTHSQEIFDQLMRVIKVSHNNSSGAQ